MAAAAQVFGIPLLADKILLDVSICDLIACRRVCRVLLDAISTSAPIQRALFIQGDSSSADADFLTVGATFPDQITRSAYFAVPVGGGIVVTFPKQSIPVDFMRSILFTQPPSTKVRLSNGMGWEATLFNAAGVKLWEVAMEVCRADRRRRVMVYVAQGSRVVIEYL